MSLLYNKFDIQHSILCKKGDFIYVKHNDLRDLTANMMSEVCKDTKIKPKVTPLSGGEVQGKMSNKLNEAKEDIRNRGFWEQSNKHF